MCYVEEIWVWYFLECEFVVDIVEVVVVVEMFECKEFVVEGDFGYYVVVIYNLEVLFC